jgi:hypothetical protein
LTSGERNLLNRKCQQQVTSCASTKRVSRAHEEHAAGNSGTRSSHRTAFYRDAVHGFNFLRRVVLPKRTSVHCRKRAERAVPSARENNAGDCCDGCGLAASALFLSGLNGREPFLLAIRELHGHRSRCSVLKGS